MYCAGKRTILSLSTYGKTILFMMYISENNTLKLRLCDGATVHLRDEYIIEIILGYYFANVAGIENLSIPATFVTLSD